MDKLTLHQRIQSYEKSFPDWPPPHEGLEEGKVWMDGKWLSGMWILGNDYRGSGFYGSYPPNYLKRVMALFPDAKRILHLFSGSVPPTLHCTRFDLSDKYGPDVQGDAHKLGEYFPRNTFDLILADPPYSVEDAEHYGPPMVNRNKVLKAALDVLEPGGFMVWLDQTMPMYRKDEWDWVGIIGVVRSGNHRFRMAAIFQRR